jgi:hypothetical protein
MSGLANTFNKGTGHKLLPVPFITKIKQPYMY